MYRIILLIAFTIFSTNVFSMEKVTCEEFGAKMKACEKAFCETPHPKDKSFMIKHKIHGFQDDSTCLHTQTLPDNLMIKCSYSDNVRLIIAKQFENTDGAGLSEEESEALQLAFSLQCNVENWGGIAE